MIETIKRMNWPIIAILLVTILLWYGIISYAVDPIIEFFEHFLVGVNS